MLATRAAARARARDRGHAVDRRRRHARAHRAVARAAPRRPGRGGRARAPPCGRRGARRAAARRRDRSLRLRTAGPVRRRDGRPRAAARLGRPRIPVGGAVDRRVPRTAVAASAAAADAVVLVPRLHARQRRAAARGRAPRGARRLSRRSGRQRRRLAGRRVHARSRSALRDALLLREPGVARAARRVGRRRRARRLHRPGGRGAVGTRPLDRWRDAPSRRAVHARPADGGRRPLRGPGRVRSPAVDRRPELRPRRGLVRPRAVGRAALRLAALPAGGRRAPGEDGRVPHPPRGEPARGRPHRPAGVLVRVEHRRPGRRSGRVARIPGAAADDHRARRGPGRARGRARPTSRRGWSGSAKIVYNYGFPGFATHGVVGPRVRPHMGGNGIPEGGSQRRPRALPPTL